MINDINYYPCIPRDTIVTSFLRIFILIFLHRNILYFQSTIVLPLWLSVTTWHSRHDQLLGWLQLLLFLFTQMQMEQFSAIFCFVVYLSLFMAMQRYCIRYSETCLVLLLLQSSFSSKKFEFIFRDFVQFVYLYRWVIQNAKFELETVYQSNATAIYILHKFT